MARTGLAHSREVPHGWRSLLFLDERLLFAPLATLSVPGRRLAIVLAAALATAWSGFWNGNMMGAWTISDVGSYVLMAQGRYDLVRQPFTARPLAPMLAHGISVVLHCWIPGGFEVLGFLSLLWTSIVVLALAARSAAPRWTLVALAMVPFWPFLLSDAGLPDPLYAALVCCLLLALGGNRMWLAATMMLPLMLCRESTFLTLFCLLAVAWRRLRWIGSGFAIACTAVGALLVRRLSAGGLPNPEALSGANYMVGKVFANTLRSLGVVPWSNVYPGLCPAPVWQMPLHIGGVRAIGVCTWSSDLVQLAWWAVLTIFGMLPLFLLVILVTWLRRRSRNQIFNSLRRAVLRDGDVLLRFCLLYGGLSMLLGPTLGVSYNRLVGYGWPLLLVALPRLWDRVCHYLPAGYSLHDRIWSGGLLLLHLSVCVIARQPATVRPLLIVLGLDTAAVALILGYRRGASALQPNPR